MKSRNTRDIDPFGLRMSDELRQALDSAMKAAGRKSLNAEICQRLQASLDAESIMKDAAAGDPYAMILAALDTQRATAKVIEKALLQIGVSQGRVKVENEKGSYSVQLNDLQKEILTLLTNTDKEKLQAILQLLKPTA